MIATMRPTAPPNRSGRGRGAGRRRSCGPGPTATSTVSPTCRWGTPEQGTETRRRDRAGPGAPGPRPAWGHLPAPRGGRAAAPWPSPWSSAGRTRAGGALRPRTPGRPVRWRPSRPPGHPRLRLRPAWPARPRAPRRARRPGGRRSRPGRTTHGEGSPTGPGPAGAPAPRWAGRARPGGPTAAVPHPRARGRPARHSGSGRAAPPSDHPRWPAPSAAGRPPRSRRRSANASGARRIWARLQVPEPTQPSANSATAISTMIPPVDVVPPP